MIRDRVRRLLAKLPAEPQYPTQGATLFVDLERREIQRAYTPRKVVESFLEGRGANMVYLFNLLDPELEPLDPDVPLQLSAGLLTGIVPSAARGQVTGWSPESHVLLDSSCGDRVPSTMKLQGIDRFVLFGRARRWTYLYARDGDVELRDATSYVGLDNIELRKRVAADLGGRFDKDLAMANITSAGERGVWVAGIMGGVKALWARGGPGAKMGSLRLKAIVLQGFDPRRGAGHRADQVKPANRAIARQVLSTSVVRHALSVRGTPFLYKPSRLLGALGVKNHRETTWSDALDAEKMDPYRRKMTGCFRCPVRCRPQNDLRGGDVETAETANPAATDPYLTGEGPDYVTVGKLGPMVGIENVEHVIRLNNIVNDLGLDSASLGSALAWAIELYQQGIIDRTDTGGLELDWGDYPTIERLIFMTASREGFGDVIAHGARAVDIGKYPRDALACRMAVKGLMQSDPHDARIIKAFALGLAVATRGMDHLRNRATLEINARINDDPEFKAELYGAPVAAAPNAYGGKEHAVRVCEDTYAVGDALGLCRFTTKLFNSPSLPGFEELGAQIYNVTGLSLQPADLRRIGRDITGLEREINYAVGVRAADDTLPSRWFDEPLTTGPFAGEFIDREQFAALRERFYRLTGLNCEGRPELEWRAQLVRAALGFAVEVWLPDDLRRDGDAGLLVTEPVGNVGELLQALTAQMPELSERLDQGLLSVSVGGELLVQHRDAHPVVDGDRIELIPLLGGG